MNSKIFFLGLILISSISCNENKNVELTEMATLVNQLKTDKNNELLSTLEPTDKDLRLIFNEGESADKVITYSKIKWADISKIPENSMKPLTENAELKILTVSKTELKSGITNGFPKEYLNITDHLQDGINLYAMQYLNEDGSEQKMRSVFFKVSNNWMIVPLVYKAFE